uniref:Basic leucine zipper ATF-like transcription factor 2 n=1 Tax=Fundulus heteroclitus TaxID=8078 RepID=A0A3Q2QAT6_FUNHE
MTSGLTCHSALSFSPVGLCRWTGNLSVLYPGSQARQPRPRVTKRREKNRDAARKSRRKQTERADELHEELQHLEQSNSALQKEIAALKKDLRLYEKALERHQPHCRLKDCGSSPAGCTALCSPPQAWSFIIWQPQFFWLFTKLHVNTSFHLQPFDIKIK